MKVLKDFRISLGYTIKDFAKILGVSNSLYEKIEQGTRKPSREFLTKLKKAYPQFDINVLFNW